EGHESAHRREHGDGRGKEDPGRTEGFERDPIGIHKARGSTSAYSRDRALLPLFGEDADELVAAAAAAAAVRTLAARGGRVAGARRRERRREIRRPAGPERGPCRRA